MTTTATRRLAQLDAAALARDLTRPEREEFALLTLDPVCRERLDALDEGALCVVEARDLLAHLEARGQLAALPRRFREAATALRPRVTRAQALATAERLEAEARQLDAAADATPRADATERRRLRDDAHHARCTADLTRHGVALGHYGAA